MTTEQRGTQQLALDLPHRIAHEREDFLVTPANEQAVSMVDQWPNWLNPALILVGPQGAGKTHLSEVWRSTAGAQSCHARDLSVEAVPSLLMKGALVVEDLPGEALDETALFHLINLARENQGFLLLTSRIHPVRWPVNLKDLASRIKAMPIAVLGEPDDALLRAILVKQFADRQIAVDEPTLAFMLSRMERSAASASQIVELIDQRSLAEGRGVNRGLIARILEETAKKDVPASAQLKP
jgi:chromosomal replication initiation ATPase DnaA